MNANVNNNENENAIKRTINENAPSEEIANELFELIDAAFESKAELNRKIDEIKDEVMQSV